jgi:hypothetical protein
VSEPPRTASDLHPFLVGLIGTVVAGFVTSLAFAVQGFSCGRAADAGYAFGAPIIIGYITIGLLYLVPGSIVGVLAIVTPVLRTPRFWKIALLVIAAGFAICFALEGTSPPGLPPVPCRVDM